MSVPKEKKVSGRKNEIDVSELYVKSDVIANIFGLSIRRVQQLTQEGIISTEVPAGGGTRRYNLEKTCAQYITHLKETSGGKRSIEAELKNKKLEAEIALKESQGELHRLKTDIATGKYIAVEEVKLDYKRQLTALRKLITGIPNRVGGVLAGSIDPVEARGIENDIAKELDGMLRTFTNAAYIEGTEPPVKKKADKNKVKKSE
jgi:phage terminase Nu1 subunit (DNA packaging protein)